MNKETLVSFRYCFQTILVPCAVFIGVLGNSVSVLVLTRKRMRSSTNVYLTALAIADIIYLMMVFSLSFQHYKNIHHPKYELYWRTYGMQCWFCDAASYTSIYITVSFTIERYIAVCHPIRGQVICTESKAKKVISVVVIMCLLCTCTTPFEYLLNYMPQYVDIKTYEPCRPAPLNSSTGMLIPVPNCTLPWLTPTTKPPASNSSHLNVTLLPDSPTTLETILNRANASLVLSTQSSPLLLAENNPLGTGEEEIVNSSTTEPDNYYEDTAHYDYKDYLGDSPIIQDDVGAQPVPGDVEAAATELSTDENMANMIMSFPKVAEIEFPITTETSASGLSTSSVSSLPSSSVTSAQDNCHCLYYLEARSSPLGENDTYRTVFMWATSVVFTFIPLILLITFNSFLVLAVKQSNKVRDKMTNVNSRKVKNKISSISQENKITRTLIAVVILFITCQTPTAIYIVVNTSLPPDLSEETINLHRAIGNIFNFLITINAASNFFLYCALSEKYRQTVKELIMGRNHIRQATLKSFYLSRQGTMNNSLYSNSFKPHHPKQPPALAQLPTASIDSSAPQSTHTGRGASLSRNSSTKSSKSLGRHYTGRNSFHHDPIPEHRISDPVAPVMCRKHSCTTSVHGNFEGTPLGSNRHSKQSGSTSSLSRSQSLILEQKIRHSPGCKKYNDL